MGAQSFPDARIRTIDFPAAEARAIIVAEEDAAMDANEYLLHCMVHERLAAERARARWRPPGTAGAGRLRARARPRADPARPRGGRAARAPRASCLRQRRPPWPSAMRARPTSAASWPSTTRRSPAASPPPTPSRSRSPAACAWFREHTRRPPTALGRRARRRYRRLAVAAVVLRPPGLRGHGRGERVRHDRGPPRRGRPRAADPRHRARAALGLATLVAFVFGHNEPSLAAVRAQRLRAVGDVAARRAARRGRARSRDPRAAALTSAGEQPG